MTHNSGYEPSREPAESDPRNRGYAPPPAGAPGASYPADDYGRGGGYGAPEAQPGYGDAYGQQGGDYQNGYDPAAPAQQGYGQQAGSASLSLDDGSGRTYDLTPGSHVIGRGQESSFRLPDTGVSRRHLEINWDGHTATLSDLGSTNGTTVNGNPVQTWQLGDGDVIRVGHSSLVFRAQ